MGDDLMARFSDMNRRSFIRTLAGTAAATAMTPWVFSCATEGESNGHKPNFIVILTDDQGYGDVGCFGSTSIRTPRLDRMAREGLKLTSFYSQPVCGPARAALMTGRYPTRVMRTGKTSDWRLRSREITIAEILKEAGYATACIGKWDLSGRSYVAGMLPNDQGFDYFFGPLGANDQGRVSFLENTLMHSETEDMGSLTKLYTDKAVRFIEQHEKQPFFLYVSHTMPHVKLGASEKFRGKSKAGLYGDVIEEIDFHVGRILDLVSELGLDEKTYVIFSSDNGPWLRRMGGSARPLRGGKGSAWEGGVRVPCIMWAPGRIPAGSVSNELVSTLDMLPTLVGFAGLKAPDDRVIDGRDQSLLLTGKSNKSARGTFLYYVKDNLHAVRQGPWKLALPGRKKFFKYAEDSVPVVRPQLYDLNADISEEHDLADQHPDIVRQLMKLARRARRRVGEVF